MFQSAVDGLKISLGERMSNSWLRDIVQWLTAQVPKAEQLFSDAMDSAERKLDSIKRKFKDISATDEWQNADFFGKGKILWDEYIVQPFSEWWSSKGKAKMNVIAGDIGNAIGTGLTVGVATILGIDISETIDEGNTLGASFAKGFSEGFDFDAVASKPAIDYARAIRDCISDSNDIFLNKEQTPERLSARALLQEKALSYCNKLQLQLMDIIAECEGATDDNMREVTDLLSDLIGKIIKWNKSDNDRISK